MKTRPTLTPAESRFVSALRRYDWNGAKDREIAALMWSHQWLHERKTHGYLCGLASQIAGRLADKGVIRRIGDGTSDQWSRSVNVLADLGDDGEVAESAEGEEGK